ncbi:hypothetical protein HYH03_001402 [Edaphochlamys debaryana]|uniref:Uncharacterized protein n=1 Tax=Edaphochlamys debaryana TaxID=47281 RepID=A0A836C586_9CHLO|nr:hypothetical protein HYH03_001402 [Edaphochlamys debaryana]|eukprot:KAG2500635.1 hypothetical protein HYH03_001402 [Edaphochlamys debaryana]
MLHVDTIDGARLSRALQHRPERALALAEAEERALLASLGGWLQAGGMLAAGLLMAPTDTCVTKLAALQAAAVVAAVANVWRGTRRQLRTAGFAAALRRQAAPAPAPITGAGAAAAGGGGGGGALYVRPSARPPGGSTAAATQLECVWTGGRGVAGDRPPSTQPSVSLGLRPEPGPGPEPGPSGPAPGAAPEATAQAQAAEPQAQPTEAAGPPKPPTGVWTSLRLDQLPRLAAHRLRAEALRRALERLAREEGEGVEAEGALGAGAGTGQSGGGRGGAHGPSPAGRPHSPVRVDHDACCQHCRGWTQAWDAGRVLAAALAVVAALTAALVALAPSPTAAAAGGRVAARLACCMLGMAA